MHFLGVGKLNDDSFTFYDKPAEIASAGKGQRSVVAGGGRSSEAGYCIGNGQWADLEGIR
jgi:hypothetical protein